MLYKGKSIDGTVRELARRYHPGVPLDVVKKTYFPKSGDYAIGSLQGATRKEILEKTKIIDEARKRASKRIKKRNDDPEFTANRIAALKKKWTDPEFVAAERKKIQKLNEDHTFAAANRKRGSKTMTRLHRTTGLTEANKKRIIAFNSDPEFTRKRLDGVTRHWNTYRLRIQEKLDELGIMPAWGTGSIKISGRSGTKTVTKRVPISATTRTPETNLIFKERKQVLKQALNFLEVNERALVYTIFFSNAERNLTEIETAKIMNIKEIDVKRTLETALTKLAGNRKLREVA
ncbi:MAG: hypothetical protein ABIJ74_03445 [archaeon]